ncbi:MAG: PAS domain-containing protein, partial [Chloroflexi bacterium]|nr:PAS domain-containing protein [Chloroflexota bacterium]
MSTVPILHIIIGGLREDYFITSSGEAHLHKLGGNALYAAIGARIWADPIGLVTRVGENYPQEWLADPHIWARCLHPEDRERVLALLERSRVERTGFTAEYRMLARDGRTLWV